jgi:hypothetical protein
MANQMTWETQRTVASSWRQESRKTAGIILVVFPTVIYGGISLLTFLIDRSAGYLDNPIRQNLFRAGHADAGVLLVLSLVVLRYVDEARLPKGLLPAGFFLSILSPAAIAPNRMIYLSLAGALVLAVSLVALGIGLLRVRTD